MPPLDEVLGLIRAYPDLPPEAVFKEDILRRGLAFSPEARQRAAAGKRKSYFIFSFDLQDLPEEAEGAAASTPEEVRLAGGAFRFRPTVVSVRNHPRSPYRIETGAEDDIRLTLDGEPVCGVEFPPVPEYYRRSLSSGKPVIDICPTIEWGYLLYLAVYRLCQYSSPETECRFCDINHNFRRRQKSGQSYTGIKSVEEVLEALEIIASTDTVGRAYTVTGGSIYGTLHGETEAEFYGKYPLAIESRFPGRWTGKLVAQALPREELQRLKDGGLSIYHPNYEVWDARLFEMLCPGKSRYLGRDLWMKRILEAAEVFGPSRVIPNFVAGVEMSAPYGFSSVEEALRSTGEGLEFYMSRGICPRFTTWCPEPMSQLGRTQGGAPLAYHVGLLRLWRETHRRHRLMVPPGYGPPGAGHAMFSVSAFMDVLPESPENQG